MTKGTFHFFTQFGLRSLGKSPDTHAIVCSWQLKGWIEGNTNMFNRWEAIVEPGRPETSFAILPKWDETVQLLKIGVPVTKEWNFDKYLKEMRQASDAWCTVPRA